MENPFLGPVVREKGGLRDRFGVKVSLQWIPGHCGIPGNEVADALAKHGALQYGRQTGLPDLDLGMTAHAAKRLCREVAHDRWIANWAAGTSGRSVHRFMKGPMKDDAWRSLPRKDQTVICGLRTGHTAVNAHLHRINPGRDPACRWCRAPSETVEHLLLECGSLTRQRERWLPRNPDLDTCLFGGPGQLKRTAAFACQALEFD